jgi:hypothetical protein
MDISNYRWEDTRKLPSLHRFHDSNQPMVKTRTRSQMIYPLMARQPAILSCLSIRGLRSFSPREKAVCSRKSGISWFGVSEYCDSTGNHDRLRIPLWTTDKQQSFFEHRQNSKSRKCMHFLFESRQCLNQNGFSSIFSSILLWFPRERNPVWEHPGTVIYVNVSSWTFEDDPVSLWGFRSMKFAR